MFESNRSLRCNVQASSKFKLVKDSTKCFNVTERGGTEELEMALIAGNGNEIGTPKQLAEITSRTHLPTTPDKSASPLREIAQCAELETEDIPMYGTCILQLCCD